MIDGRGEAVPPLPQHQASGLLGTLNVAWLNADVMQVPDFERRVVSEDRPALQKLEHGLAGLENVNNDGSVTASIKLRQSDLGTVRIERRRFRVEDRSLVRILLPRSDLAKNFELGFDALTPLS
jgi:hypothetical protein